MNDAFASHSGIAADHATNRREPNRREPNWREPNGADAPTEPHRVLPWVNT
jgi:hypothetical protein